MPRNLFVSVLVLGFLMLVAAPSNAPWPLVSPLGDVGLAHATAPTPPQDAAHARAGFWRPPVFGSTHATGWKLNHAEIKTIHDKLRQISDAFRETPAFKSPVGFEGRVFHGIAVADGGVGRTFATGNPPKSDISLHLYNYLQTCETCPIKPADEAPAFIRVTVNSIDGFYDVWQQPFAKDREGGIYLAPMRIGEVGGFPLFQAPGHAPQLLITKNTKPVWLPVSQERYIRSRIASLQQTVARLKPPNDQPTRREIAQLEAELGELTAAERAAPAHIASERSGRKSGLASPGARGARALVATNPAFFDLQRPRTDFQVIVIETFRPEILLRKPENLVGTKLLEAMKTVDWGKITALIE